MTNHRLVVVNDLMQQGYTYTLTEPMGENFAAGFEPELTPAEMLALGVFGGRYMTDCAAEFPTEWFAHARLSPTRHDPALNYFGVNASQPLAVWRARGWLHPDDPRGWFQWYGRYYMGRRMADDARPAGMHADRLVVVRPASHQAVDVRRLEGVIERRFDVVGRTAQGGGAGS